MVRASHIIAVMVVLLMVLPGMARGGDTAADKDTLRGIKGVSVVVEAIEPEVERAGLTQRQIRTDVELKFLLTRLNVFPPETGGAFLYVRPFILKHHKLSRYFQVDMYVFRIDLELRQAVYLTRNKKPTTAPTWSIEALGATKDLDDIRNAIKGCVDIFLSAWLSVNPK
jgi:hypothetical protein